MCFFPPYNSFYFCFTVTLSQQLSAVDSQDKRVARATRTRNDLFFMDLSN